VRIGIGIDEASGPITLDAWVERVRDAAERGFAAAWSRLVVTWGTYVGRIGAAGRFDRVTPMR
jgi:hypothetical protein